MTYEIKPGTGAAYYLFRVNRRMNRMLPQTGQLTYHVITGFPRRGYILMPEYSMGTPEEKEMLKQWAAYSVILVKRRKNKLMSTVAQFNMALRRLGYEIG